MTIQELAEQSGVKEKTIRLRLAELPGITTDENESIIPDGSRWFYDSHRYTFDDRYKRIDALLNATSHYRYVDESILKLSKESFKTMLNELIDVGLLQRNGSNNPYGANGYDTTLKYEQIKSKRSKERIKCIVELFASATGKFVGGVISSI